MNEVASELGVSRQRVQQIIVNLPNTKQPKKDHRGRYQITNDNIKEISRFIDNNTVKDRQSRVNPNASSRELIETLKSQLAQKDEQLSKLQNSLEEAHKLIDQSQRLQLDSISKNKELEQQVKRLRITGSSSDFIRKPKTNVTNKDNNESHVTVEDHVERKNGFWSSVKNIFK